MAFTNYDTSKPQAGVIIPQPLPAVADTYYVGMPLKYNVTPTATAGTGNTGNGTCTDLSAGVDVKTGTWVITWSAALTIKVEDPDGALVFQGTFVSAETFNFNGLKFKLTAGGTAWVNTDTFDIAVGSTGYYTYEATEPDTLAWEAKTISSAANIQMLVSGSEVLASGIVDDSNSALTVTDSLRAALLKRGIVVVD